uniref:Uncharacterized protein n=1 Tax=Compsopogon caeruleus TaxID=31354 RepID=A0A7S1TCW7_9RHOD|mmetsp:Transcript_1786/g.3266  ORF Transcript_1786/g.3266 Transcript_1786/m.3266 type:complete len:150 (+) Transcript_1786:74-523(+)|eukprot:CAMPEP_0184683576 /NCGR_PEP_ID=MMETSP0312-20130426/11871_1 /TAXON_ID=31354 /ORGANISM="Compsopogon coeruleus, Strain SAG 36.94" /LENGTH=149 /DNA_ID=CAMNT_0027136031 /DNA_START=48 /DNA_END=497 /DNA_ORIENTATION=-
MGGIEESGHASVEEDRPVPGGRLSRVSVLGSHGLGWDGKDGELEWLWNLWNLEWTIGEEGILSKLKTIPILWIRGGGQDRIGNGNGSLEKTNEGGRVIKGMGPITWSPGRDFSTSPLPTLSPLPSSLTYPINLMDPSPRPHGMEFSPNG